MTAEPDRNGGDAVDSPRAYYPDPLPPNWELHAHEQVSSTQDLLEQLLAQSPRPNVVVVAGEQRSGRGRRQRDWDSPRGGLWCSLSLAVPPPPDPFVALLVAAAARESVARGVGKGAPLTLKWPNDLMIGERKWGGVLVDVGETLPSGELLLRIGVGLNLQFSDPPQLSPGAPEATTIAREFGHSPSPGKVLGLLLQLVEEFSRIDREQGRSCSHERVIPHIMTLGRKIRWDDVDGQVRSGTALGLDPHGGLIVKLQDGRESTLHAARIRHVRRLP